MTGPFPAGYYTQFDASSQDASFQHLRAGQRYRVARAFTDYDGCAHLEGETWVFLGTSYLAYHGGRSLFVSLDGVGEWHIRMQDEAQEAVLNDLASYIAAA